MKLFDHVSFSLVTKGLFFLCVLTFCNRSSADDLYNDYIRDVYLLESYQARAPYSIIRYVDADQGKLLKSVLSPTRARTMILFYFFTLRSGATTSNLPQLLESMLARYKKAFSENQRQYEAEYLDTLEISATILNASSQSLSQNNTGNKRITTENKETVEATEKIAESLNSLNVTFNRITANSIRSEVQKHMFSLEGGLRALNIAETIYPIRPAISYTELNVKQKYDLGKKTYFLRCVFCHQVTGKGIPNAFPSMVDSPSLQSETLLLNMMIEGKKGMPGWKGVLSAAEIAAVANYVKVEFTQNKVANISEESVVAAIERSNLKAQK